MSIARLVVVVLAGCRPDTEPPEVQKDTDGDGLSDRAEAELGTDAGKPDTDGDGLSDGDEVDTGADPLVVDTDADGYTDRDEVYEGRDPADPASVIYTGGWPYYFEKEELKGGSYTQTLAIGARFARVELTDQYGDRLDLFDFWNETKPVVIDLSSQWAGLCKNLSSWLTGGEDPSAFSTLWPAGPAVIARGDVYWITILGEDSDFLPASPRTARQWASAWPSERIPVLAENDYDTYEYCGSTAIPSLVLLDPDLKVAVFDPATTDAVLTELAVRFPD